MFQLSRFLIILSVLAVPGLAGAARNIPAPDRLGGSLRAVRHVRTGGIAYKVVAVARKNRRGFGVCLVVTARVTDRRVHGIDPHPLKLDGMITYSDGSGTGWLEGFTTSSHGWSSRIRPSVPRTFSRCYPKHKSDKAVPRGAMLELDVSISSVQAPHFNHSPKLGRVVLRVSRLGQPRIQILPPKP